jgi:hypothetical protein
MLTGLVRQFGVPLDTNSSDREVFAYLDLVSHSLWREHPAWADPVRQLVRDASLHYLVMSAPMVANVAWSFGRVLELAEEHPNAVESGSID